jgi:hypothetical protein
MIRSPPLFEIEGVKYRYRPAVDEATGHLISPYKDAKYTSIQEIRRSAIPALRKNKELRDEEFRKGRLIMVKE